MQVPPILIMSPPQIRSPRGNSAAKFQGAEERCKGLGAAYAQVASDLACHHFDAETVTTSSTIDGVHLDVNQHRKLGVALAAIVKPLISED